MNEHDTDPKTDTQDADSPAGQHKDGDAQRPGDHLDKDQPSRETIPRKSSFL